MDSLHFLLNRLCPLNSLWSHKNTLKIIIIIIISRIFNFYTTSWPLNCNLTVIMNEMNLVYLYKNGNEMILLKVISPIYLCNDLKFKFDYPVESMRPIGHWCVYYIYTHVKRSRSCARGRERTFEYLWITEQVETVLQSNKISKVEMTGNYASALKIAWRKRRVLAVLLSPFELHPLNLQ